MSHNSIQDDAQRNWRPEEKATEAQMELVLELLIEMGETSQKRLAQALMAETGMKIGTARAAVSASLLFFRQAGWVEVIDQEGRSNVWKLIA